MALALDNEYSELGNFRGREVGRIHEYVQEYSEVSGTPLS